MNEIILNFLGLLGAIVLIQIAMGNIFILSAIAMGHNLFIEIYKEVNNRSEKRKHRDDST